MYDNEEHMYDLLRHLSEVREAGQLLASRLMEEGRIHDARLLLQRVHVHDASKFSGIEWLYLHRGPDTPKEPLDLAIQQHQYANDHHPEFWDGIGNMPEAAVLEMVCDWYARSQEFGDNLQTWIKRVAYPRYKINMNRTQEIWILRAVSKLLRNSFKEKDVLSGV